MNPTEPARPEQQPEPTAKPEILAVPEAQPTSVGVGQQPVSVPTLPNDVPAVQPVPTEPKDSAPPITGPALAADQDVIEAEWVEKAEEVVKKTAGDPHAEEDAVEDLQVDYLKKRYNKDIKKSKDG